MANLTKLSRRAFIGAIGLSGVAVGGLMLSGRSIKIRNKLHDVLNKPEKKARLFVQVGSDNIVTIWAHRCEMGQGVKTSLPMVVADEMEADWDNVRVMQAPGHPDFGNQTTAGSLSVQTSYMQMREVGASVRLMLEKAAAQIWEVELSQCRAELHRVVNLQTGSFLTFGDLAEAASTIDVPLVSELQFKSDNDFRYIGKGVAAVDLEPMVTGQAEYAVDIQLPNMAIAVVEHPPAIGAKLVTLDDTAARKVPGVIDIVTLPHTVFPARYNPLHGVAVVAENTWAAIQGRKALKCSWSEGRYTESHSEANRERFRQRLQETGESVRVNGDPDAAFELAHSVVEANYSIPYLAHAPMEPPATVALVEGNKCTLWASTQNPQFVRANVAQLLDTVLHNVTVNVALMGGGFGRKSKGDFCAEAALIAKAVGRPVKLIWLREDDIRFDYYHAQSEQKYLAALDENKNIIGWIQRAAYPSIRSTFDSSVDRASPGELVQGFTSSLYDVENFRAEVHKAEEAVRIGWLRSVCHIQHAFANNCFADELAYARGMEPAGHLLALIGADRIVDPEYLQITGMHDNHYPINTARLKRVIREVVGLSGSGSVNARQGWGVAAHYCVYSYCAVATQVLINDGKLSIEKVCVVADCGKIVHPDNARAQIEGAVIFGLSFALLGKIDVEKGMVVQSNFHDYPLLKMNQCPDIEVRFIDSNEPPTGLGEVAVPPVAPSVANAIYAASGQRIRELPFKLHFDI
ncbi:xanthine dehydrogenase family protein molybdopterin-binding subunit [Teredinibacter sp. KSP-S5-2]|uniref:xanthine dehydrogenase family protein molybdopterin-binding subunit n=1 Tax=Teredinibacter sp. KSP-S5-2 TaxID=3034506 RepID=UPI002934F071|nr:molybdopterin cofactor-binding domain-containing protein [Teredinibacter sp. KSP-S5-2]WNO08513.1 molybdopterin-dependent oxidoreductase [Teredinibacter sp. KSP-S5-2]